jgi:hypothetical protein
MTKTDLPERVGWAPPVEPRVLESRRRVEERVQALRAALHEDTGLVPRSGAWVLPVLGFAVGFGIAVRAFRRRRRARRL